MEANPNENETKAKIAELIGAMATLFPGEVNDERNRAYVNMLKDIPIPVLTAAIDQCCAECKFLPSVAEIREKAATLTRADRPPALQAWKTVTDAIQHYGYDRSLTALQAIAAENPIAAEATQYLGWRDLCLSENQIADRAHFSKIYDQLVERRHADERLLPAARELKELNRGQPLVAQLTGRKE